VKETSRRQPEDVMGNDKDYGRQAETSQSELAMKRSTTECVGSSEAASLGAFGSFDECGES
jgi:hypothetical protein